METDALLAEFGVELQPGGTLEFSAMDMAESCYIHHTRMPVAIAAFARISPAFARGRFPKTRLVDVVAQRPGMDADEAVALAAVCGATVQPPFWSHPGPFTEHLLDILERYRMDVFFRRDCPGENHYAIRPRGFDWSTDEEAPAEMKAWRAGYKALPVCRQMMVATVLWLYRGGQDKTWLGRLPCAWHAADAIPVLRVTGHLADWARLVALYSGW